ncbi:MAG: hypothetical protein LIO77_08200 [Rikenellaceae bacterium]|nr:hypothetical protein [Rikenellaceae bacterium]
MNGSSRFVVTVTDGRVYSCILFTKDTSQKLARECKAFAFDGKVHYRVNRSKLRITVLRLLSADEANEGLRQLMAFLDSISPGTWLAVCPGDAAGSARMLEVAGELHRRSGREAPPADRDRLLALANYRFAAVGKVVRKAGPALRNRRTCRYCGKSIPETTFLSKAHTISEALGNKTLYTNDECDKCNATFARTIEPEFINRLSPFFPLLNIAGKNGGRKVRDKYYSISREEKFSSGNRIILKIHDNIVSETLNGAITDIEMRTESNARAWVPQNIYRSLCKFTIGTLDGRMLRYFRKTVRWINGENFPDPLPPSAWSTSKRRSCSRSFISTAAGVTTAATPICSPASISFPVPIPSSFPSVRSTGIWLAAAHF